jgi:hypothetical protein
MVALRMTEPTATCPNCGARLAPGSGHCFACGRDLDIAIHPSDQPVLVRLHRAQDHRHAVEAYVADLPVMASRGYFPVGQSYGDDDPDGLLDSMFTGSQTWSRPGTLAVTFRFDAWSAAERRLDAAASDKPTQEP